MKSLSITSFCFQEGLECEFTMIEIWHFSNFPYPEIAANEPKENAQSLETFKEKDDINSEDDSEAEKENDNNR